MELRGQLRSELFRDVARGAGPQPGSNAAPGLLSGRGTGAGAHLQAPGQLIAASVVSSHAFGAGGQPASTPVAHPAQADARGIAGVVSHGQIGPAVSAIATTIGQTGTVLSATVQSLLAQGHLPAAQSSPQDQASGNATLRQSATPAGHLAGTHIPAQPPGVQVASSSLASPQGTPTALGQLAAGQPGSGHLPTGHATSFPTAAVVPAATPGQPGPLQAAAGMPLAASPPASTGHPLPAAMSAPVPATPAPVSPQAAVPARADGMAMADRAALQSAAAQAGASSQAAATLAAPAPVGNPQVAAGTNPLAQQAVPASQAGIEARGNTVMHGADRAAQRSDGPLPHGHTVEAGLRRHGLRGLGVAILAARKCPGDETPDSAIRRNADYLLQWLYWALTITAWLCLALLITAVTPLFGPDGATAIRTPVPLKMIGAFAGVGLCAALTAWLVSRVGARN